MIILDACRPDYLGCYNPNFSNNSKHIDQIALEGKVFKKVKSPGSATSESLPRIFSGNRYHPLVGFTFPSKKKWVKRSILAVKSLWEVPAFCLKLPAILLGKFFLKLRMRFFDTKISFLKKSFVENIRKELITCCVGANPYLDFGFKKGFDEFYNLISVKMEEGLMDFRLKDFLHPKIVTEKAIDFIERTRRNYFLYIHFLQPHAPYLERDGKLIKPHKLSYWEMKFRINSEKKILSKILNRIEKAYCNNIRIVDREVYRIFTKALENSEDLLFIVTSDHGEIIREYPKYKIFQHYPCFHAPELIRVPLVIWSSLPVSKIVRKIRNLVKIPKVIKRFLKVCKRK